MSYDNVRGRMTNVVPVYCEAKLSADGPCMTERARGSPYCDEHRNVLARNHVATALECLTDEFNAGRAGPSGLRAQAIAHVRYALAIMGGGENSQQ